jgi:hypothetical protein
MVVPCQTIAVSNKDIHPDNCPACEVKGNIVALEIGYQPSLKSGVLIRRGRCPVCHIRSFSHIGEAAVYDPEGLDEKLGQVFVDYRKQGVEIICNLCRHMTKVLYNRGGNRMCPPCTKRFDEHNEAVNRIYREHENAT